MRAAQTQPARHTRGVRRYLVVANQTVATPALGAAIRERAELGECRFRVVVPCTGAHDIARYFALVSETMPGYVSSLADAILEGPSPQARAAQRLSDQLDHLAAHGVAGEGEVGDEDPLLAIGAAVSRAKKAGEPFDEILLSTLPASISRWVSMDLPNRTRRRFAIRVVHIEADERDLLLAAP